MPRNFPFPYADNIAMLGEAGEQTLRDGLAMTDIVSFEWQLFALFAAQNVDPDGADEDETGDDILPVLTETDLRKTVFQDA